MSFDMYTMEISIHSMHSRIDTETMKQVHWFKKRYYWAEHFFQVFCRMAGST